MSTASQAINVAGIAFANLILSIFTIFAWITYAYTGELGPAIASVVWTVIGSTLLFWKAYKLQTTLIYGTKGKN